MFVTFVLTFWSQGIVVNLMQQTGLKGAYLVLLTQLPLYVVAAASWRKARVSAPFYVLAALCGLQFVSAFEGEFAFEGALRALPLPNNLAWAVVFAAWPSMLPRYLRWCVALWAVATALEPVNPELFVRPNYMLAYLTLCLYAFLRDDGRVTERAAAWWVLLAPAMVAIVIRSTFRAGSIAAALILLWMAVRRWEGRLGLAVAVLAGSMYVATIGEAAPSFSRDVDRTDYVGRFRAIDEDNFSGRGDIWEGVWADIQRGPDWLWTGVGYGDVDIHIARVNPYFNAGLRHGERVVHSHNQLLDVLIATGIPGSALLLVLILLVARRSSLRDPTAVIGVGFVIVATANVVFIDGSGATTCLGLLLARVARDPSAPDETQRG